MDTFLIKDAEEVLYYVFLTGYKKANNGLKNYSYYFVEMVLIKMAQSGALGDMFKRNVKKMKNFLPFNDDFTNRTQTSFCYVHPVEEFVRTEIKKQSYFGDNIGKKKEPFFHS